MSCLLQAWVDGMYKLWEDGEPDEPMFADYSAYTAPIPTITIGNIVPDVTPATGPTAVSFVYVGMALQD